ncbi:hypothetical protein UFOVP273_70 [uncultured Caudovirales phage]|uniref:Uncharacterized protein n=1 Tax=uncultured Caudovirales phage TaxID=2100421 RepID=A0A6J5LRV4_9CAUD|nr:hypothetical protein UFOVP273_70 [uncultured Caudovirales phage]
MKTYHNGTWQGYTVSVVIGKTEYSLYTEEGVRGRVPVQVERTPQGTFKVWDRAFEVHVDSWIEVTHHD